MKLRVADLDYWLQANLTRRKRVTIRGAFRGDPHATADIIDLFELSDLAADTVRLLMPSQNPVAKGKKSTAAFPSRHSDWWNGWASVLVASVLMPPLVDPARLADLMSEKRRIQFCCDTNALCSGVAAWLLSVLDNRADIITSAVVDRELAAWSDQDPRLYKAARVEQWARRTHLRIARATVETPPDGVVVHRLSPEQGALMLAKLRDETASKSPDADMLLVELARGPIRDQPRNTRVIYLTGDRNNAHAATSALGADNVLFAIADRSSAERQQGRIIPRGWWAPPGPLGSVMVPPAGALIWSIMAACDFLQIEADGLRWWLRRANAVKNGCPSDWADPWISVEQIAMSPSSAPTTPTVAFGSMLSEAGDCRATASGKADSTGARVYRDRDAPFGISLSEAARNEWLLQPHEIEEEAEPRVLPLPVPRVLFPFLWRVISTGSAPPPEDGAGSSDTDTRSILTCLGAIDAQGGRGPNLARFEEAWRKNDLDWFHAQMLRLHGYRNAVEALRGGSQPARKSRVERQLRMARALGEVGRLDSGRGDLFIGDAAVNLGALIDALSMWFAAPNQTLSTPDVCDLAATQLHLTPGRFERAMLKLWGRHPDIPIQPTTGGSVAPGRPQQIVMLGEDGPQFRDASPGLLSFGSNMPMRFLVRTR